MTEEPKPKGAEAGGVEQAVEPEVAGWRRYAPAFFTFMLGLGVFLLLAAIATPKFAASRKRADERACYSNQKTIAGAIEMYNLDFHTNVTELAPYREALESIGYLQSFPTDPGGGPAENYHFSLDAGNGISCKKHGPIQAFSQ
jgi:hypothetical protein